MIKRKPLENFYEREQFGIKTKSMPQQVYECLDKKAKKREIVKYIIELVEADLDAKSNSKIQEEIQQLREDMLNQLCLINNRLSNMTIISSTQNYKIPADDNIKEGQLIEEEIKVVGKIEEDYDSDF